MKKDLLHNTKSKEELLAELAAEDFSRRTISMYRYVTIDNPAEMRDRLYKKFDELNCKGRIYVAPEGINAQMNVPEPNWDKFDEFIQSTPEFTGIPYKIAVEERGQSFLKLIVRLKNKIVADGLDDSSFDPSNTGKYMTAEEVNTAIEDEDFTVIDMRNAYEAEVGHFEKAQIMPVDSFKEQLAKVEEDFEDDKDKKVLLYCTGGIRCEKASAWMKHKGFNEVYHVKGGIIDYAHQVKQKGLPNKFKGKNFVFDERLGERISDEIISDCHLCEKVKCDTHHHCENKMCHTLFIGCEECTAKYKGYCSFMCRFAERLPHWLRKKMFRHIYNNHSNQFKKNYLPNRKK